MGVLAPCKIHYVSLCCLSSRHVILIVMSPKRAFSFHVTKDPCEIAWVLTDTITEDIHMTHLQFGKIWIQTQTIFMLERLALTSLTSS